MRWNRPSATPSGESQVKRSHYKTEICMLIIIISHLNVPTRAKPSHSDKIHSPGPADMARTKPSENAMIRWRLTIVFVRTPPPAIGILSQTQGGRH